MPAAGHRRGRFFLLLVDLGPGAVVSGIRIEINTGYSCFFTAACHRRRSFFSLVDLGPGAAVSGMLIEINTGHSCF